MTLFKYNIVQIYYYYYCCYSYFVIMIVVVDNNKNNNNNNCNLYNPFQETQRRSHTILKEIQIYKQSCTL